jgi:3-hydroxyisobutyrate dehydrogenase
VASRELPGVAFVGLGNMGWPMAGHLVSAGFPVVAVDADPDRPARFADEVGGAAYADPSQLAGVRAVVLMLPTSAVVHDVMIGTTDLASSLMPGTVVVDMSSSDPQDTRELAEALRGRDLPLVDAPVSGGVARAIDGTLTIMLGADDESAAAMAETVVGPLSREVVRTGGTGTGHAMKALNNFIAGTCFVATSEALIAGQRWGLSRETMVQIINTSTGRSFISELVMPTVLSEEYVTGFALGLLVKDVRIADGLLKRVGVPSAVCDAVRDRLGSAEAELGAAADHARAFTTWSNAG